MLESIPNPIDSCKLQHEDVFEGMRIFFFLKKGILKLKESTARWRKGDESYLTLGFRGPIWSRGAGSGRPRAPPGSLAPVRRGAEKAGGGGRTGEALRALTSKPWQDEGAQTHGELQRIKSYRGKTLRLRWREEAAAPGSARVSISPCAAPSVSLRTPPAATYDSSTYAAPNQLSALMDGAPDARARSQEARASH